jgi:hypothetical protein
MMKGAEMTQVSPKWVTLRLFRVTEPTLSPVAVMAMSVPTTMSGLAVAPQSSGDQGCEEDR